MSARQLLDAVSRVCHELPIAGMDVVEVSPPYDHAEITALLGNRIVLEALAGIARRRRDAQDGVRWQFGTPLLEGRGTDEMPPPGK
jgi:agmatinase